jgi:hypothetical protein
MAAVVWVLQFHALAGLDGHAGTLAALLVSSLTGAVTFVAAEAALRSPELTWLAESLKRRGRVVEVEVSRA